MKKLLSVKYSKNGVSLSLLILRVFTGLLLLQHGYPKLVEFEQMHPKFMNFMGLGSQISLSLIIFAEFFCSILLILGLFTRLAAIPIIIGMSVVVFVVAKGQIFTDGEKGMLFLVPAVVILICGPGKISLDKLLFK